MEKRDGLLPMRKAATDPRREGDQNKQQAGATMSNHSTLLGWLRSGITIWHRLAPNYKPKYARHRRATSLRVFSLRPSSALPCAAAADPSLPEPESRLRPQLPQSTPSGQTPISGSDCQLRPPRNAPALLADRAQIAAAYPDLLPGKGATPNRGRPAQLALTTADCRCPCLPVVSGWCRNR